MRTYTLSVDVDASGDGVFRRGIPHGILRGIKVDYTGQPGGCDLVLTCVLAGVSKTLLTLTDNNTDFPLQAVHEAGKDNVGADVAAGKNAELVLPVVGGELVATVDEGSEVTSGVVVTCEIDSL